MQLADSVGLDTSSPAIAGFCGTGHVQSRNVVILQDWTRPVPELTDSTGVDMSSPAMCGCSIPQCADSVGLDTMMITGI